MLIETIHESLINGQKEQAIKQIKKYGVYPFFVDYAGYLDSLYQDSKDQYEYFYDAVILYLRNEQYGD